MDMQVKIVKARERRIWIDLQDCQRDIVGFGSTRYFIAKHQTILCGVEALSKRLQELTVTYS